MALQRRLIFLLWAAFSLMGWGAYIYTAQITPQAVASIRYDVLSPDMTVRYVRSLVWYHSRGKLLELKGLMKDPSLSDNDLKIKIENMLRHRTSVYIDEFNHLNTPVKNLGDWYAEHFDFNGFLKEIDKEVLKRNLTAEVRIDRCTDIMELYQNQTTEALKKMLHGIN